MSKTDTDDQVSPRVAPVVLIIGLPDAQTYLEENEVLEVLYGCAPIRLSHTVMEIGEEFLTPEIMDDRVRLKLFDRFPDESKRSMAEFVYSDSFFSAYLHQVRFVFELGALEIETARVKAVVADRSLFTDSACTLVEFCERFLPEAALFSMEFPGHGKPERMHVVPEN